MVVTRFQRHMGETTFRHLRSLDPGKDRENYLDVKSTSSSEFGKLRRDDVPTQPVYTPSPEELRQTGDTSSNSPILSLRRSVFLCTTRAEHPGIRVYEMRNE
jgi:hypothetical protein